MDSYYFTQYKKFEFLQTSAVIEDHDGILWCSANGFNGICTIDLSSKEVLCFKKFENEDIDIEELYSSGISSMGSKIFFFPGFAGNIAFIDKNTGIIDYVEIDELERGRHPAFGVCARINNIIWLFPLEIQSKYIYLFNMDGFTVEKKEIHLSHSFIDKKIMHETFLFGCCGEQKDIYLGTGVPSIIIKYDTRENKWEEILLRDVDSCIYNMTIKGDVLYCLSMQSELFEYNLKNNEIFRIYKSDEDSPAFSRVVVLEDCIWLFPFFSKKIVKININTYDVVEIDLPEDIDWYRRWGVYGRKYYEYSVFDNHVFLWPDNVNKGLLIDTFTNEVRSVLVPVHLPQIRQKEWKKKWSENINKDDLRSIIDFVKTEDY